MRTINTKVRGCAAGVILAAWLVGCCTAVHAEVRLPHIFGDHMILQQDKPVKVWGWADPGERVNVSFDKQNKTAVADKNGDWSVTLDPMKATFGSRELIVSGKKNLAKLTDVLIGEVWLCGGQSNMEWPLRASRDADLEIGSASCRSVRFFRTPQVANITPQNDIPATPAGSSEGHWRKCVAEEVENCTAVGYYFARRLHRRSMTYDMNHHTNIIRELQFKTWRKTPNTGLIVTFDTNSNGSIHPGRKYPVGQRSARWALSEVYGVKGWRSNEPLQWRGPIYGAMEVKDGRIVITFEEGTRRGLRMDQDDESGFYIAGKDKEFHQARARVVADDKVEVWSDAAPEPVAVRYGWSNLPLGPLMNGRELPAYPFRTDKWPMTPHQSTGSYVDTCSKDAKTKGIPRQSRASRFHCERSVL